MDAQLLAADLERDEDFVAYVYDDANDARIQRGYTVEGTATFGIGFTNITQAEARAILAIRIPDIWLLFSGRYPWAKALSEPRQRALANMAFQLGLGPTGLPSFTTFLGLMEAGRFEDAANDLRDNTKWARQSRVRAKRIEALIRGDAP